MSFKLYDISVIPIIMFLTKIVITLGVPKKYSPVFAMIFGIIMGIVYFSPGDISKGIIIGLFLGASSVGFYSAPKNIYQEYRARKAKWDYISN